MLPPSTRSPQLLSLGFSAGHCGEDPVKDRRPLDREAQRVTPEASSHCEPTSGGPCAPVRAARCWILYAPFFRARANSAWAGLRARILYRPCPGGRIQGGRSGSSTSFTSLLAIRPLSLLSQPHLRPLHHQLHRAATHFLSFSILLHSQRQLPPALPISYPSPRA